MSTNIFINEDTNWNELMNKKCVCGHTLTMHSFTQHPNLSFDIDGNWYSNPGSVLWVSICISCPYDKEKDEFTCKEFRFA